MVGSFQEEEEGEERGGGKEEERPGEEEKRVSEPRRDAMAMYKGPHELLCRNFDKDNFSISQ